MDLYSLINFLKTESDIVKQTSISVYREKESRRQNKVCSFICILYHFNILLSNRNS